MRLLSKIKKSLFLAGVALAAPLVGFAAKQYNVLVLCAYNPDSNNLASTITTMEKSMKTSGIDVNVTVESLGYDYLYEYAQWKGRMIQMLNKYRAHDIKPDVIVTLGQEAMSSYMSLDPSQTPDIPVICGMCSRYYVELPTGNIDISNWKPDIHDITESATLYNVVGGSFYNYDIQRNIDLIHSLYPTITDVSFLSDNSYGGICMKSLVMEYANCHRDVKIKYLDGRHLTIQSATDSIAHLPENTAILIGTWRFDKESRFFITSSMAILKQNNTRIPAFTVSYAGLNDWAIGGYIPMFQNLGERMSNSILDYLTAGKTELEMVKSHYVFNSASMEQHEITPDKLPKDADIINKQVSIVRQYAPQILGAIALIATLALGLIAALRNLQRIRKLKKEIERKQKELIIAKNRAESNSMLKTSFLANMSHEIRTPLNAVVGFSQVIASQCDSLTADERARIVEIINKNCNLLTGLINGILDISRIESDRAKYEIEDIDLVEHCQAALSSVQMANRGLPIEFIFESSMDKFMFTTDRQRFQQVLINLLGNAVKFTQQGHIILNLQLGEAGNAVISVTDTGKGVPPDKAEEIFGRFVKLDEYSNGTGLGLSLCRLIVEKFHGKIWVDTTYTAGARFVFSLPPITKEDIL